MILKDPTPQWVKDDRNRNRKIAALAILGCSFAILITDAAGFINIE